jgi:hypothetical protein
LVHDSVNVPQTLHHDADAVPQVRRAQSRDTSSRLAVAANIVLGVGGAVSFAAFVYYCLRYPASGDDQFLTPAETIVRYLRFAALPVILFGSLRLRPVPRVAIAGLFFSVAAALYATEIALDVSGVPTSSAPLWDFDQASEGAKRTITALWQTAAVKVDTRDLVDVLDDMHRQGVDGVPAVMLGDVLAGEDGLAGSSTSVAGDELLPLGGISNSATVLCNESGGYVTYMSDEHGFRNPPGIWSAARADVAAVGQSLTQGYCVPDGKTFVDLVRQRYPVTLNLGESGESSLLQLAAIKEYLPRYAPKIVLWFFYEGQDLRTLYEQSAHPLVLRYLNPTFSQHLPSRQQEIDNALRLFVSDKTSRVRAVRRRPPDVSVAARSVAIIKLWHVRERFERAYGIESDDGNAWLQLEQLAQNLLRDSLREANSLTRSWGGTLYFVYLPSWNRYQNTPTAAERDRLRVLNVVNALGIHVIDVHSAFAAESDPLSLFPFRRFGHYNEAGNRIAADAILKVLARDQPK